MNKQDIDAERRRQRRLEEMGTNSPICLACGYTKKWYNFHGHHIAGQNYDREAIEFFCTRCHGDFTERQRYHPRALPGPPRATERLEHFCLGLDDILTAINHFMSEWSDQLNERGLVRYIAGERIQISDRQFAHLYFTNLASFLPRVRRRFRYHGKAAVDEWREAASGEARSNKRSHRS